MKPTWLVTYDDGHQLRSGPRAYAHIDRTRPYVFELYDRTLLYGWMIPPESRLLYAIRNRWSEKEGFDHWIIVGVEQRMNDKVSVWRFERGPKRWVITTQLEWGLGEWSRPIDPEAADD